LQIRYQFANNHTFHARIPAINPEFCNVMS
jgi:hypothetical protein